MTLQRRMNFGIVGCGGFCRGNHLPSLAANPRTRIRALCDLNEPALEELAAQYHPDYVSTEFERLFADPEIDAVVCATKPDFRLPVMRAAVKYRKPLFVEKPLAFSVEDTFAMLRLMKNSGVPFMVGFNRPYSPMMTDVKRLWDAMPHDGNITILYRMIGEAALWPGSHFDAVVNRKESTLIHEATHIFQLLSFLTGTLPERIFTAGGGNMDNLVTLEFPGKITACVAAGDNGSVGFPKEYIEIDGGGTTVAGWNFVELEQTGVAGRSFFRRYPFWIGNTELRSGRTGMTRKLREFRASITPEEQAYGYYYSRQVHVDKGHYGELEFFRLCVEKGIMPPIGVEAGAAANITAAAALESFRRGESVRPDYSSVTNPEQYCIGN